LAQLLLLFGDLSIAASGKECFSGVRSPYLFDVLLNVHWIVLGHPLRYLWSLLPTPAISMAAHSCGELSS